ncbi:MAG: glycogen debranching enzyme GlgX, partial [Bacteroidota bacterium]
HNEANGEDNRDGHNENFSDNGGTEGETDDVAIRGKRAQRQRNLLATVLLSQGTPMLRAGDEIADSQQGNNNAYSQDNPISWIDWRGGNRALLAFTRRLSAFRRAHPCLRQAWFLHGRERPEDGAKDVIWLGLDGGQVNWRDPGLAGFCLLLRQSAEAPAYASDGDTVLLAFNGGEKPASLRLPQPRPRGLWLRALDTAEPEAPSEPCREPTQSIAPQSIVAFAWEEPA